MSVSDGWSRDEVPTSDAHCFLMIYLDVRNRQPPSEKVHQIIARTALFVSEHGGQSEIVLRVKQGSNPTFGFLMPDHHLHSYFRYIVDHPQLLKDGSDADTNKGNTTVMSENEHAAPSSGALSLLGAVYESGGEDEDVLPASSKSTDSGNDAVLPEKGHKGCASHIHDKEMKKEPTVTEEALTADKDKPIFTKKNPAITGNSITAAHREKVKGAMVALTTSTKSENSKLSVSDTKEVILEPPSFMKGTVEKIVEFILRNGKEFEEKLIAQDRMTGRFPFLLPNNPYHSYYLKILQETQESKSRGGSSECKDRRSSSERRDRRGSSERRDRRSSSERKDSGHEKEVSKSKGRGSANKDSSASDRSSAEPSEKQLNEKGKFQLVIGGVKKEPPRKVTADEAAAIVMAATRGLGSMDPQSNTVKDTRDIGRMQDPGEVSKPVSSSEVCTSLTSSGQVKKEGIGIIDDDWISNTIAKAVAVAASKEADSSEASMTNAQKLKAERLRRARMFTAIIKGGGSKGDPVTSDPVNESAKVSPADLNLPGPDTKPLATEREGSSVPSEREGSNMKKQEKDSDDEQNKARKYRKHHPESNEDIDDLEEESYKHSRKRHRSRGHSMDAHKHKQRQHSKDREYMHENSYSSSEDERRSSKSRHRHRHDHYYAEDAEHRSSHRHRRNHGSGSKRKHKDDRAEPSQSTSEQKYGLEQPPGDTAQSSNASTEVPDELKAKIRAMLLETL
ncbi:uncharacterized protein [Lolium perenne]|uniref:uncharacterized protein isoform X2 n=2 Tax=Lolium perenne TaxID=4522 RepID=UPI0021F519C5|nr:uncharacterized protein LOC127343489 isoform X2 [Lolium perenne]